MLTQPASQHCPQVVLVGIPGAFTGTCYGTHIPDFVNSAAEIKAKVSTVSIPPKMILRRVHVAASRSGFSTKERLSESTIHFLQGVDEIVVLGVNDFFVMKEFANALGAADKVSRLTPA